jgi:hypothetical protein
MKKRVNSGFYISFSLPEKKKEVGEGEGGRGEGAN